MSKSEAEEVAIYAFAATIDHGLRVIYAIEQSDAIQPTTLTSVLAEQATSNRCRIAAIFAAQKLTSLDLASNIFLLEAKSAERPSPTTWNFHNVCLARTDGGYFILSPTMVPHVNHDPRKSIFVETIDELKITLNAIYGGKWPDLEAFNLSNLKPKVNRGKMTLSIVSNRGILDKKVRLPKPPAEDLIEKVRELVL